MSTAPAVTAALVAACAHPLVRVPTHRLDTADATALLGTARRDRLTGAAFAAIAQDVLVVPQHLVASFAEAHRAAAVLDVRLEHLLVAAVHDLVDAGIDVRALKGAAIAHSTYPDPALRSGGDIDLLVRGDQLAEAIQVLTRDGGERRYPEPRAGFDRRFGKGAAIVRSDGVEIDLHRSLAQGPVALLLPAERLFEQERTVRIADRPIPALAANDAAVHAAIHAICGSAVPSIAALRDVLWTSAAIAGDASLARRAEDLRVGAPVAAALRSARATFGAGIDDVIGEQVEWARGRRTSDDERRHLDAYGATDQRSVRLGRAALGAAPWPDRVALGAALLAPTHHRTPRRSRWSKLVASR